MERSCSWHSLSPLPSVSRTFGNTTWDYPSSSSFLSRSYGLIVNSNPASTPRICRVKGYLALPAAPWASYVRQKFLPHRNFCMRAAFPAIPPLAFLVSKGQREIAFVMIARNLPMGHLSQTYIAQYDRMLKEELLYQLWFRCSSLGKHGAH